MKSPRTDEATFRANLPRTIKDLTILEMVGYQPGTPGNYPYAYALARTDYRDVPSFSTHMVIYQDDGPREWVLQAGHYDISTRRAAWLDLLGRIGHCYCRCCVDNDCECDGARIGWEPE